MNVHLPQQCEILSFTEMNTQLVTISLGHNVLKVRRVTYDS